MGNKFYIIIKGIKVYSSESRKYIYNIIRIKIKCEGPKFCYFAYLILSKLLVGNFSRHLFQITVITNVILFLRFTTNQERASAINFPVGDDAIETYTGRISNPFPANSTITNVHFNSKFAASHWIVLKWLLIKDLSY